jgi:carbon storage regulator CsrA
MQFFSRRINESLVIGDDIAVTVLEIAEAYVRLRIDTPDETFVVEQARDAERSSVSEGELDHVTVAAAAGRRQPK